MVRISIDKQNTIIPNADTRIDNFDKILRLALVENNLSKRGKVFEKNYLNKFNFAKKNLIFYFFSFV